MYCSNDHFVCDECHNQEINAFITEAALNAETKAPIEFAERMMVHHCTFSERHPYGCKGERCVYF